MEKVLREMVMQVSEKVKETEEKINHSYLTLRKIILSQVNLLLSQSTVSKKLPELYNLLTGDNQDEETVINQLGKFS